MGSCTFTLATSTPLPTGDVMITGTVTLSNSYATGGDTLDLSAYIKGAATSTDFTCVVGTASVGNPLAHNQGTATAGKILAFEVANGAQIAASANTVTYIGSIIAVGPAY